MQAKLLGIINIDFNIINQQVIVYSDIETVEGLPCFQLLGSTSNNTHTYAGQNITKNANIHPCIKWISNPSLKYWSGQDLHLRSCSLHGGL